MQAISIEQMRKLEENASANGTTVLELMERAGKACAEMINKKCDARNAIVFCGPGNNGGDGLVCARYLVGFGFSVLVVVPIEPKTDAAKINYERAKNAGIEFIEMGDVRGATNNGLELDIIVDALLGIGAHGNLCGKIKEACQLVNSSHSFKVSIDIPTGMDAETGECDQDTVIPDVTICIHAPKIGMITAGRDRTGELWIVDIGL